MTLYDLQILDGPDLGYAWANRINDSGQVVGLANAPGTDDPGPGLAWWRPIKNYQLERGGQPSDQLFKVNNAGDAVTDTAGVFDINAGKIVATLQMNYRRSILKRAASRGIKRDLQFRNPNRHPADSPPRAEGYLGIGINNNGDVVGRSGNHGFLYSASQMTDVGAYILEDINDKKLAVGEDAAVTPCTSTFRSPIRSRM